MTPLPPTSTDHIDTKTHPYGIGLCGSPCTYNREMLQSKVVVGRPAVASTTLVGPNTAIVVSDFYLTVDIKCIEPETSLAMGWGGDLKLPKGGASTAPASFVIGVIGT